MKSLLTLEIIHDRLVAVILRETPLEVGESDREYLHNILDCLCWILGHKHNRTFELNLARLAVGFRSLGIAPTLREPLTPLVLAAFGETGERYVLISPVPDNPPAAIQCITCGMVSHNPSDVQNLYCGKCHVFHEDALRAELAELEQWGISNKAANAAAASQKTEAPDVWQ